MESITIGKKVQFIDLYAFLNCTNLKAVNIKDLSAWCGIQFGFQSEDELNRTSNPLSYAQHLYLNGEEIKDLVIPNDISSINDYAFYGGSGFTSIEIPNNVTKIGRHAFKGCSGATELTISSNLEDLEWGVFFGCSRLKNVYCLPEKKTFIWTVAFDISDIEHIILYVPKDLVGIYMKEEPWNKFKEVKPVLP